MKQLASESLKFQNPDFLNDKNRSVNTEKSIIIWKQVGNK